MSALPPKADIGTQPGHVCFVPKADISGRSCEPLDDAEIPFRRIVERLERCLIARAVMDPVSFGQARACRARESGAPWAVRGRDGKLDGKPRAPRDSGSSDRLPPLHDFRL